MTHNCIIEAPAFISLPVMTIDVRIHFLSLDVRLVRWFQKSMPRTLDDARRSPKAPSGIIHRKSGRQPHSTNLKRTKTRRTVASNQNGNRRTSNMF